MAAILQLAVAGQGDALDLGLGQHDAGIGLRFFIEEFRLARGADVFIEDHGRGVGVRMAHVQGLFQGGQAAEVGAVGQMLRVPGAGALDEGDVLDRFAVGRPDNLALLGQLFHLHVGDDVLGEAVAQLGELGGVVGLKARRHDHGAHLEGFLHAVHRDGGIQHARLPVDLLDHRVGQDPDLGIALDRFDLLEDRGLLQGGEGVTGRGLPEQLGRIAAQFRLFFHQDHVVAVIAGFQRRA